nr:unnamed protein product [Digitaria exilis]
MFVDGESPERKTEAERNKREAVGCRSSWAGERGRLEGVESEGRRRWIAGRKGSSYIIFVVGSSGQSCPVALEKWHANGLHTASLRNQRVTELSSASRRTIEDAERQPDQTYRGCHPPPRRPPRRRYRPYYHSTPPQKLLRLVLWASPHLMPHIVLLHLHYCVCSHGSARRPQPSPEKKPWPAALAPRGSGSIAIAREEAMARGSAVFHITSLEEEEAAAARRLWRWTEGVKPAPAAEALRGPEASEHRAVRRRAIGGSPLLRFLRQPDDALMPRSIPPHAAERRRPIKWAQATQKEANIPFVAIGKLIGMHPRFGTSNSTAPVQSMRGEAGVGDDDGAAACVVERRSVSRGNQ